MKTDEISEAGLSLLKAFAVLEEQHKVPTVHAACNVARLTFMDAFDLVNELFSAGLLAQDLRLTDAGRKAVR